MGRWVPWIPGAAGSLSTNKLVRWLHAESVDAGIDFERLNSIHAVLTGLLLKEV